jgi:hypothetical protein
VDLSKAFSIGEGGLPRRLAEGKTDEVFAKQILFLFSLKQK